MIEKIFAIFFVFCTLTTCAISSWRYSTSMQDAMELPNDINTSHTMIREQTAMLGQQSAAIAELVIDRVRGCAGVRPCVRFSSREDQMVPSNCFYGERRYNSICSIAASSSINDGGGIVVMLASENVTTTGINPSWLLMRQASGTMPMVTDVQPRATASRDV